MQVWEEIITGIIFFISGALALQGLFTLVWMLHAWNDPAKHKDQKSPKKYLAPKYSFTALIPARFEQKVIKDTIKAVSQINYPEKLKEILILCRFDDKETIAEAHDLVSSLNNSRIRVLVLEGVPVNKPKALNFGLQFSKNEIVTIFDAEDEPHSDIYNIVNTTLLHKPDVSVVQSGVQLMNYKSPWFSALNCMEYFFWFKSGLHFFSNIGKVTPLGGNTVFFKKNKLEKIGGWDENCLTEDADVGIRLSAAGAKIAVIYDEKHTTREETPNSTGDFIKQRARWNQGFLQIFFKMTWTKLPSLRQKIVAVYILLTPVIQAMLMLYLPVALYIAVFQKIPVGYSMFSFVPFLLFLVQLSVILTGIYEFTRVYNYPFPFFTLLKTAVLFLPYQLMLMYSAFRALYRYVFDFNVWEKTTHVNAHRVDMEYSNA
jgi:glycosyltransferase XagB